MNYPGAHNRSLNSAKIQQKNIKANFLTKKMNNKTEMNKLKQQGERIASLIRRLPLLAGNEAVRFVMKRFERRNWLDTISIPWKERQELKKGKGRALLVKSGRLRRSIRITSLTSNSVQIGTDVPYAKAHNEGFEGQVTVKEHTRRVMTDVWDITKKNKKGHGIKTRAEVSNHIVKAHTRMMKIPKRQFMGSSHALDRVIQNMIVFELRKIFK